MDSEEFKEAKGLKILTSKKALLFLEPQKPSAAISKRAPSLQTDDVGKLSPERGFKTDSVHPKSAVISLISLCLKEGNPSLHTRRYDQQ